jgi:hypothetical protein
VGLKTSALKLIYWSEFKHTIKLKKNTRKTTRITLEGLTQWSCDHHGNKHEEMGSRNRTM